MRLRSGKNPSEVGEEIYALVEQLYPLCRSITGNGVRETLRIIGERIPLQVVEVPSGTQVFDWQVPREWNVTEAWVCDSSGRKVIDFARHNLHLVSYSTPVRAKMTLDELKGHLHSLPDHPEWIPYRTSYYSENWGFCLSHDALRSLPDGMYEVLVDTTLADGALSYAECVVPGESENEVLIYTHTCHPSLANDNCSGMALATQLARHLGRIRPRWTYRFVFGPGTIGSITWLAQNEDRIGRIRHGLVIGLVGDPGRLRYKCSRAGDSLIDRAARHVLRDMRRSSIEEFTPYGYDERQFCSPGINLALGRITRSPEAGYLQYHSSADDLALVRPEFLSDSFDACCRILEVVDSDTCFTNLSPKCEPQLGRRGLYRATGGEHLPEREFALLWMLNQSDGQRSVLDISERSGLSFESLIDAAGELEAAALLRRSNPNVDGLEGDLP